MHCDSSHNLFYFLKIHFYIVAFGLKIYLIIIYIRLLMEFI